MMRAAVVRVFGPPENIEILNIARPVISSESQVLVRNHASGVNPVDTYIRAGVYGKLPNLPYVPGKDGAGVVVEVGSSVKNLKVGDRVWYGFTANTAAEYSLVDLAFPLPDELSFAQGASIAVPYLTAYRALFTLGKAKKGDAVLVHGASGGVGSAAVQLAKWKGLTVVGTAGTEQGLDFVKKLGADDVFNHRQSGYIEQIKTKYSKGFNLILEMAAHTNLNNDLGLLGPHGQVAVIGNRAETTVNARLLMTVEGKVFGVQLAMATPEEQLQAGADVCALFRETASRPAVAKTYSLSEMPKAHHEIIEGVGATGNLVVNID